MKTNKAVLKIVTMGVLSALSIVLMTIIRFPIIPTAAFLEYEPADVPIIIAALIYGPVAGILTTVVVSVIQAFTVSAASGWVGCVMHIIATGTLAVITGLLYQKKQTFKGAIFALIIGTLAMTAIIIPSNLFFTVKFWGYPFDVVLKMIPTVFVPFTFIKGSINSIIIILLYKPVMKILKAQR